MKGAGEVGRGGLGKGIAAVETGAYLTASAVRHAGWWVEWHMRVRPSAACRATSENHRRSAFDLSAGQRAA
jgi:hypothetical protein